MLKATVEREQLFNHKAIAIAQRLILPSGIFFFVYLLLRTSILREERTAIKLVVKTRGLSVRKFDRY